MADTPAPPTADRPPPSDELREAIFWHEAWAAAILLPGLALAVTLRPIPWLVAGALLSGAAPGLGALLLRRNDTPRLRALLLALWAGCGALACMLAGGVSGPLAAWCLAPAAAAAVFGGPRLLSEGVALAVVATATAALVGLAGLTPAPPPEPFAFWLGFIGLLTTSFGLGAGLLLSSRRTARRATLRRATETDLERMLSGQPHLILTLDPEGRVASAFGYAPEGIDTTDLPGRTFVDLAVDGDRPKLEIAIASGTGECAFSPLLAPDRACVIALRKGADGRLVAVLRDATVEQARQAALQAAREEAEALNAGKSRFLANMSHELRTPLNAIMGFSDVMRTKLFGELQPKYADYADMIHDAGGHLLDLINDVLDISKIEAARYELSRESFDAREAISGALRLTRLQADEAGISLRGLLPPETLDVNADHRAIKQIVLNLVSNAIKFTPRGGSVTVSARGYVQELEIVVSDSGVGIAQADLERIGRPYEQAGDAAQKTRGTGLGLSLVRALAELHGGGMSIESRLGEGTSVAVRLPVLLPPRRSGETAPQAGGAKIIAFTGGKG